MGQTAAGRPDDNGLAEFLQRAALAGDSASPPPPAIPPTPEVSINPAQWAIFGDGIYAGAPRTTGSIPPAVYEIKLSESIGIFLERKRTITDRLFRFPDSKGAYVLNAITKFWDSKHKFLERKQIFKRGVLMWGPAGSGKTCVTALLMEDIVKRGGIVTYTKLQPSILSSGLQLVRKLEPDKPIVSIMEDIDETIERYGEHAILSLLDGEDQIDNVCHVATTNFPENLGARLLARPSRFDEIVKIGMPSVETRKIYLDSQFSEEERASLPISQWVKDTDGMSLAMLRELVVATQCLDRGYEETIKRLNSLKTKPVSESEFEKEQAGFLRKEG